MIARLQSAAGYAGTVANTPGQFANQLTTWQQTLGDNLSSFGKTIGLQQDQQANDAALIAALQAHATTAIGQMQALEAGNELAGVTALQLLKIQSTLSAAAQMQATQDAVANDRRAMEDAALQRFLAAPAPAFGGQRF
jgi:P-type conjugative transfer protein TrbJ